MPLYEYSCKRCQHTFERIQKFSDPPATECPKCGGAVEQVLSPPAIQFKGSGWYVTDYARKSAASGGHGKSMKPADTTVSDSGKETIPASKSSEIKSSESSKKDKD